MSAKQIQGGLYMLKQLSAPQKIFGVVIFLFAWSPFTEQASADEWGGTPIAFLSDRDRDPLFWD